MDTGLHCIWYGKRSEVVKVCNFIIGWICISHKNGNCIKNSQFFIMKIQPKDLYSELTARMVWCPEKARANSNLQPLDSNHCTVWKRMKSLLMKVNLQCEANNNQGHQENHVATSLSWRIHSFVGLLTEGGAQYMDLLGLNTVCGSYICVDPSKLCCTLKWLKGKKEEVERPIFNIHRQKWDVKCLVHYPTCWATPTSPMKKLSMHKRKISLRWKVTKDWVFHVPAQNAWQTAKFFLKSRNSVILNTGVLNLANVQSVSIIDLYVSLLASLC